MSSYDPMGYAVALPLGRVFYPFGFALRLRTNSAIVVAVAERMWGRFVAEFEGPALEFRVVVAGTGMPGRTAIPQGVGQLIVASHDAGNYGVCDLERESAAVWVTEDVAANGPYLERHFLEPFTCFLLSARRVVIAHAACVALDGQAVLLCGASGAGKTSVAWGCARRGWTFLSGDATQLVRNGSGLTVAGRPFSIRFREMGRALFPELRDYPVERGPGGKLDIAVDPVVLGASIAQSAQVSRIVMLERGEGGRLESVSAEEMFAYFDESLFFGPEAQRNEMRARVRDFLKLPLHRLIYGNPDEAEMALRGLVAPC